MNVPQEEKASWSPRDYCHVGPVYIRKNLLLAGLAAASLAVLGGLGPPRLAWGRSTAQPPVYAFNDPALQLITGRVQITDAGGQVRYVGEIRQGHCTGRGKIYGPDGRLWYEGLLEDGAPQGSGEKDPGQTGQGRDSP